MTSRLLLLPALLAFLCGCSQDRAPAPAAAASAVVAVKGPEPQEALDRMDTRTAVPLVPMMANHQKQNMRDHLAAVQEIVAAVTANDFQAIEKSAGRIGYSEQMGMMCKHMGAGAPGFTKAALRFHHTADTIAEAAKQKNAPGVLAALGATLSTCTSCHATFKQEVVDDAKFASLTTQAAPSGPMHP